MTTPCGALANVCPLNVNALSDPSMLVATYRDTRALDASSRASYQVATIVPVALSTVMAGSNWVRIPSVRLSLGSSLLIWN